MKDIVKFLKEDIIREVFLTIDYSGKNNTIACISFDTNTENIPDDDVILSGFVVYSDNGIVRGDYREFVTLYRKIDDLNYELSIDEVYSSEADNKQDKNEDTINEYEEPIVDENEILKQSIINTIYYLKHQLESSDYKIIKCYEYSLIGKECTEYDIGALHIERDALRNEINELEMEYNSIL